MCFGTFISLIFIHDLGMALYFEGGTKETIKVLCIQKKVIRLITGIKNMNPVDKNLRKIEFLQ
jgi:hypothetical protein